LLVFKQAKNPLSVSSDGLDLRIVGGSVGLKSYPKAYFELTLVGFILVLGMSLPSAFLPIFARQLDPAEILVGLVSSSWFISRLFTELPSGILAERFGRFKLLIGGLAISAVGALLCSAANTIYVLILGWALWGLGTGFFFMCSSTMIFDLFKLSVRGQALGTFQALEFVGGLIGAPIGSFMVGVSDYRAVFVVASILMVFSFSVAFLSKSLHQIDVKNAKSTSELYMTKVLPRRSNWNLTVIYIDTFSRMLIWAGFAGTFFPLYVNLELGMSVELIGLIVAMRTMGIIVATATSGRLSDKFGRKPVAILGMLLEAGSLYAHSRALTFEALTFIGLIEGLGFGMVLTTMMVLLSEVTPPKYRGGAIGMDRTFMSLGGLIGPLLFMAIYELCGSYYAFLSGALIFLFNLALMLTVKLPKATKEDESNVYPV
jgi:MFS family permease